MQLSVGFLFFGVVLGNVPECSIPEDGVCGVTHDSDLLNIQSKTCNKYKQCPGAQGEMGKGGCMQYKDFNSTSTYPYSLKSTPNACGHCSGFVPVPYFPTTGAGVKIFGSPTKNKFFTRCMLGVERTTTEFEQNPCQGFPERFWSYKVSFKTMDGDGKEKCTPGVACFDFPMGMTSANDRYALRFQWRSEGHMHTPCDDKVGAGSCIEYQEQTTLSNGKSGYTSRNFGIVPEFANQKVIWADMKSKHPTQETVNGLQWPQPCS